MWVLVENENFEEELRHKRKTSSDGYNQHQQMPADILYYYQQAVDSDVPIIPSIMTTFYSFSEVLLNQHRVTRIQQTLSGPDSNVRVSREGENIIKWEIPFGGMVRHSFSEINSRVRPPNLPPYRCEHFVGQFSGDF